MSDKTDGTPVEPQGDGVTPAAPEQQVTPQAEQGPTLEQQYYAQVPGAQPGTPNEGIGYTNQQVFGQHPVNPGYQPTGQVPPYQPQPFFNQYQQLPVQERQRRGPSWVVGLLVVALVGAGAGGVGGYFAAQSNPGSFTNNALTQTVDTDSSKQASIESIAAAAVSTVVEIKTSGGEGSGVVISTDGLIITNNHVIADAVKDGSIEVDFHDGKKVSGKLIGRDPTTDIAVVKASGVSGLQTATFADSSTVKVGQGTVAIGSPFDLPGTVTHGIVSAVNRTTTASGDTTQTTILQSIQTDAPINPGNSGGALLNMQGQVIGINSSIYSPTSTSTSQGGSVGIGFAIPSNVVKRVGEEIAKTGQSTQAILGVGLAADDGSWTGAKVASVTAGGAAAGVGIKVGQIITKIDNTIVDDSTTLIGVVHTSTPGQTVTLTFSDNSTVQVKLGSQVVKTS
jgi:putative serine protease PepD